MSKTVAVIGAGPAGLMAAEVLSAGSAAVTVHDRMASAGRKFLMAGRGGLNLTHSEPFDVFATRYGEREAVLRPMLEAFPPSALVDWANGLGAETFVGSSGRVFPKAMKASPLLRAWLARLSAQGVQFHLRDPWSGWAGDGRLLCGSGAVLPDATVLALGGASWPRFGSDGGWAELLRSKGIEVAPFRPSNVGFSVGWSEIFRTRFAGQPLKNAAFRFGDRVVRGEAMVTAYGIEGGAIYALSPVLRDAVAAQGHAELRIDLRPDQSIERIAERLDSARGKDSAANFLRKALALSRLEINLLREAGPLPEDLPARIKAVPLTLTAVQPLARAISTAGGVSFAALDENLMFKALPNVYAAGEMLDWEAPTGGYLLQACFATGAFAARAILRKIAP
ncbi:MAG: TIGR03862 family flavoprotein [Rhizomicrobium sp.]